jgi:ribonuclease J
MAGQDELVFLPLGGSDEIGMNLNAYGFGPPHDRKWIVVDIGVTFGGPSTPGVELILPDPAFLIAEKHNILGIVLTHAHEDHIGAIAHLWPKLKARIYATPFTAFLVREKLKEHGLETKAPMTIVPMESSIELGPFKIKLVTLTHSIPEPNGLAIETPLGTVWHTGDWKIDPDPQIGAATDDATVRSMGERGVLAMICDSTNVFVEGQTGSEADVRASLAALIAEKSGKVIVTAFASNVARVESAIKAGEATGRSVCLVGRSMHRIVEAAKSVGLLADALPFVGEAEAAVMAPSEVLYLCTGSQGEPRAALSRIAAGTHRHVKVGDGDTVIFSSRVIPGNETAIFALYNRLSDLGADVITDREWPIHVSGHPARDELRQMYQWARPQIAVPVHGERRHLLEHAKLARELQVPQALAPRNGELIRLAPAGPVVIDEVPAGRLYLDGQDLVAPDDDTLLDRRRMGAEGLIAVTLAASNRKRGVVAGPEVRVVGFASEEEGEREDALDELAEIAEAAYNRLSHSEREDVENAEEIVGRAVRKAAERAFGKRPLVEVVILSV